MCAFSADIKKFNIGLHSSHFPTSLQNVVNANFDKRDNHGKSRNVHRNTMASFFQSLREP